MGTMCGWSRLAAASASAEAGHVARRGQLALQDHLEGDDAVEADLPGLVDDAHAAAGDLLQQFVVAEVADARQFAGQLGGAGVRSGSADRRSSPAWRSRRS